MIVAINKDNFTTGVVLSSESAFEAAEQGVLPVQFAKHNDKGAPIFTVTLTCGIVELFLIATIFSASTYQFFYNVSLSLILIPYFFSAFYFVFVTFKKDGIDGLSAGRINFYRVIAIIGAIYSIFLIYSGGLAYFMITTIFIGPGLALYISEATMKSHLRNIYRKCDTHSRAEIIDLYESMPAPR